MRRTFTLFAILLSLLLSGLAIGVIGAGRAVAGPTLLIEAQTGKVLYAEDADDLWHPASLTKIMTAYLTFEALKSGKLTLESKITNSEAASLQPPSKIGLPIGAEMSVDLALRALIIKSANDVAMMLAEAIGGSEQGFVEMMNATAKKLGMTRTTFVNPNGLPAADQITTARDLAKLSRAVIDRFPEHAHYWSMGDMRIGRIYIPTHNGLLKSFDGADGLKTGFICDSGYNIVATATREGRKLVAVVLGEASGRDRNIRAASLLDHGFQTYGWKDLLGATTLDRLPVASDARGISSIRSEVMNFSCNGRRNRSATVVAKARQARAKNKIAAAKASGPAAVPQTTGSNGKDPPAAKAPAAPKAKATAAATTAPTPPAAKAESKKAQQ